MKNNLHKKIRSIVKEELKNIFSARCILTTSRERNLTEILTDIRAVTGITVVGMVGSSQFVGDNKEVSELTIKYLPFGTSIRAFTKHISKIIKGIDGVMSIKVLEVNLFEPRD